MAITAGYDVGGAHLKVALAEDGRTIAVRQIACPLWRGLDQLDAAFAEAAPLVARADTPRRNHDRRAVRVVPRPAQRRCGDPRSARRRCSCRTMRIWMGPRGFGDTEEAACRSA